MMKRKITIKNKDFVIELPPCRKYIFILDKHVTFKELLEMQKEGLEILRILGEKKK